MSTSSYGIRHDFKFWQDILLNKYFVVNFIIYFVGQFSFFSSLIVNILIYVLKHNKNKFLKVELRGLY